MPKVKLKGLKMYPVKGKWYVYVRATGARLVKGFDGKKADLIKLLETPEMIGAYNITRDRGQRSYPERTLGWLVAWFTDPEQCEHFKKRSPSTQDEYKDGLACLEDVYDAPLAELRTHDVVLWRDKVEKKKWPAFANKMVTALSTMFSLAKERGWIDTNPAKEIRRTYKSNKNSNREWLPQEWATVMKLAPMPLKITYMIARHLDIAAKAPSPWSGRTTSRTRASACASG